MTGTHHSNPTHAEIIRHLGPLTSLAGTWEGDTGVDIAPAKEGSHETHFRERLQFDPIGPVVNGSQVLYGLRYSTVAWPLIQEQPFHEEVGSWLWDAASQQVMRCFMVPRGVLVNAGGTSEPDAKEFHMAANAGNGVDGILSTPIWIRLRKRCDMNYLLPFTKTGSSAIRKICNYRLQDALRCFTTLIKTP